MMAYLSSKVASDTLAITIDNHIFPEGFIEHAKAAFSLLGANEGIQNCKYVLAAIQKAGLTEVSRRDVMRLCRTLRTKEVVQAVLDQLAEYGYLTEKKPDRQPRRGRNPTAVYTVNTCQTGEK